MCWRRGVQRVIVSSILQAIGLFIATNIDDIVILSLFFVRGQGQPGTTRRILAGQYLGFLGILGAAVAAAFGAQVLLPEAILPYFGLIPRGLGLWAAWHAWRNRGQDDDDEAQLEGKRVSVWAVAAVTFANGGDNIGVYVPVFVSVSWSAVLAYCIVFLFLVAVLVFLAMWISSRKPIAEELDRCIIIIFSIVLLCLVIVLHI